MLYADNIHFNKKGLTFTDKHGNNISVGEAFRRAFVRVYNWILDIELMVLHWFSDNCVFYFFRKQLFQLAGTRIGRGSTIHMGVRFFFS